MHMKFLLPFLLLGLLSVAHAGINVEFDKDRIEAGQNFTLSLVIPNAELPDNRGVPSISDLQGFSLNAIDSTDDRVRDFFMGVYKVRKYHFRLTAPKQTGAFQIPLTWEMNGKNQSLGKVRVDVQRSFDAAGMSVTLTPSKKTVYEGEQFSVTMQLLAYENFMGGLNLAGIDLGNDFVAHRADLTKQQFTRSAKPGVQQELNTRIAWLAAIRPGNLSIPELKFKYQKMGAPKKVEKRTGNAFFSSVTQEPEEATARSGIMNIQVKALPAQGKPTAFTGLVGQYQFSATVDRNDLQVGEALTLLIAIKGNGKPGSIPDPEMPSFADFRSVPPESQVNKTEVNGLIWTERKLKIYLYPKKKGEFKIAPIKYSWFDPSKGAYVEQSSPEFVIRVEKGDITQAAAQGGESYTPAPQANTLEQKEIEQLGADIRHIHTPKSLIHHKGPLYRTFIFWLLLLLPLLLIPVSTRYIRKRKSLQNDPAWVRRQNAQTALQAQWKEVESLLNSDSKGALSLIENALLEYLGAQIQQKLQGLTRQALQQILQKTTLASEVQTDLYKLLDTCDQARFSPLGNSNSELQSLFAKGKEIAQSAQNMQAIVEKKK